MKSIAAQQFDPHGWAELLFTHACMLAKTMGLHHVDLLPPDTSADETLERAKVLRSLYARDKSLCITRGCICWLPSDDCNIVSQLKASVEQKMPFSERLHLSVIQDDIRRPTTLDPRHRSTSSIKLKDSLQSIEQQLNQYARTTGILDSQVTNSARRASIALEFLATRILALQTSSEPRNIEQVRSDARASCLLLLIAHGDQDAQVVDAFRSCIQNTLSITTRPGNLPTAEAGTLPFTSVLDGFSLSAFFILLDGLLRLIENDGILEPCADLDLLRKVATCYSNRTLKMLSSSYHRKVALSFHQLLTAVDMFKQASYQYKQGPAPPAGPTGEKLPSNSLANIPSLQTQATDFSGIPATLLHGDLSNNPFQIPSSSNIPLSWESWLNAPSSLGPPVGVNTPSAVGSSAMDGICSAPPNNTLFTQLLGSSFPDVPIQSKQWSGMPMESQAASKRRRTHDEIDFPP